jgi:hypothetical protein
LGLNETARRSASDVARRRRFFAQLERTTAVDCRVTTRSHREAAVMKHCPKCRMESRSDADWCWHCGYSYEDAEAGKPPPSGALNDQSESGDRGGEPPN